MIPNLLVALIVTAVSLGAQPVTGAIRWDAPMPEPDSSSTRRGLGWKLSLAAAAAASVADTHSSWGRLEANPVLRGSNGRFGLQSVALKALITGGAIGAQYLILRKHPKAEKYGIAANLVMAGVLGAAAVANYRWAAQERATSGPPAGPAALSVPPVRHEDIEFVPRFGALVR